MYSPKGVRRKSTQKRKKREGRGTQFTSGDCEHLFKIPIHSSNTMAALRPEDLEAMRGKLGTNQYVIIDEISMMGTPMFGKVCSRTQEI